MLSLDQVRSAALTLPLGEQLELIDVLQENLRPPSGREHAPFATAEAFWAEMDARLERYVSGADPGVAWEDARKEADAILRDA